MSSIEKRTRNGRTRWYARYRDPAGAQRVKVFGRKLDAERYLTTVEASKLTGSYVDPERAKLTVGDAAATWLGQKVNFKPTTLARYRTALDVHVLKAQRRHNRTQRDARGTGDLEHADAAVLRDREAEVRGRGTPRRRGGDLGEAERGEQHDEHAGQDRGHDAALTVSLFGHLAALGRRLGVEARESGPCDRW
jgi:hypothetical protein